LGAAPRRPGRSAGDAAETSAPAAASLTEAFQRRQDHEKAHAGDAVELNLAEPGSRTQIE
jgi:hypothetical protein